MHRLKFCAAVAIALACMGCAEERFVGRPGLTVQSNIQLPPPTTTDLIVNERPFVIGPLDRLAIDVYGVPELSRTVQVDASGQISLPLAGAVQASGKTPGEVSAMIADSLRGRYVRDPQVTVNLTETLSQVFTVDGEVEMPGNYPVIGRMTLMRAVARGAGTTEFARTNYVVVFRRVNNQEYAALYDLRAIRGGAYADPEIFANDVIWVGESRARRVFRDILQASGLITTPIVAILQGGI